MTKLKGLVFLTSFNYLKTRTDEFNLFMTNLRNATRVKSYYKKKYSTVF